MEQCQPKLPVALIVLVSLLGIVHFAIFLPIYHADPARILTTDSYSYLNTARAVLTSGHFAVSPSFPDVPQLIRTPGYPAFLIAIFFVFGETHAWVIVLQILCHLGTVISVYALAGMLWNRTVALVAACIFAVDFISFVGAQTLLTETLFTCMLSLTILAALRTTRALRGSQAAWWALLCGLLLSASILIRPIAYYVIIPLFVLLLGIRIHCGDSWKQLAYLVLGFALPCLLLVGGWQWRNYRVAERADFSVVQGANLLFYKGADIVAQRDGIPFTVAQEQLGYARYKQLETAPDIDGPEFAGLSRQWQRQGSEFIGRYPWLFIKGQFRSLFSMLLETDWNVFLTHLIGEYSESSGPGGDLFKLSFRQYIQQWILRKPHYVALFGVAAGHLLLLYTGIAGSLVSILHTKHTNWPMHLVLWLIILYLMAFSAGAQANPRFRTPLMPFFAIYGGHGLMLLFRTIKPSHGTLT